MTHQTQNTEKTEQAEQARQQTEELSGSDLEHVAGGKNY